jgi:hypothetical protein
MKDTLKILPSDQKKTFERIKDDGDFMAHFIENQENGFLNFTSILQLNSFDETPPTDVVGWMQADKALANLRDSASILLTMMRTMEKQQPP